MDNRESSHRRFSLKILVVLLSFVSVISILLIILTLSPGESLIQLYAASRLHNLLGQEVRIGSLETNLISRLDLHDIEIYQIQSGDTIPFLNLKSCHVTYSLRELLKRRLTIKTVDLDDLSISIRRDSTGIYNLPMSDQKKGKARDSSRRSFAVQLKEVHIRGSSVEYADRSTPGTYVHMQNIDLRARHHEGDTYQFRLQSEAGRVEYGSTPLAVQYIELLGSGNSSGLTLDSASVYLPGLALSGTSKIMQLREEPSITGDLRITGNPGPLVQSVRRHVSDRLLPIEGDMDVAIHIEGSLANPTVAVQAYLPELNVAEIEIRRCLAQASIVPGSINIHKIELEALGGEVDCEAELTLDSLSTFQLRMRINGIDLKQALPQFARDTTPYRGRINGTVSAAGAVDNPASWDISANLKLGHVTYRRTQLPDFNVGLNMKDGRVDFRLQHESAEVLANGRLTGDRVEGRFSAEISRLEHIASLLNIPELTGRLDVQGSLEGRLNSPTIRASIRARKLKYRDFLVDSLSGGVLYERGRISLIEAYLAGVQNPIDTIHPPFDLSGISGGISYEGHFDGPLDNLKGNGAVNLLRPGYRNIQFDHGRLRFELDDHQVRLSTLELRKDSLLIQGNGEFHIASKRGDCDFRLLESSVNELNSGDIGIEYPDGGDRRIEDFVPAGDIKAAFRLPVDEQFSIRLDGNRINLMKIQTLFPRPRDMSGSLEFGMNMAGSPNAPRAELEFILREPRFRQVEIDSIKGELLLADDRLNVRRIALHSGDHCSWAAVVLSLARDERGKYAISGNNVCKGEAHGSNFKLGTLNPIFSNKFWINGLGSFNLKWDGTLAFPHLVGEIVLKDGSVELGEKTPTVHTVHLNSTIQDSTLLIKSLNGFIRQTPFLMRGMLEVSKRRDVRLQLNLSISDIGTVEGNGLMSRDTLQFDARIRHVDLALLQPFVPGVKQLSGDLNTTLMLSGSMRDPKIDGHLVVRKLALQPHWLSTPFTDGVINVSFDRNEVKIDTLLMRMNDGIVSVSGNVIHERGELRNVHLKTYARELRMERPKQFVTQLKSADFSYRNKENHYLLDGDVVLGDTRFLMNFKPQSILPFTKSMERPVQELPSFLAQTRMNIRIRESDNIWIDNNLARMRLHAELNVIGNPARPNMSGRVTVVKGYILFLDRKFKITRGVVDFVDPEHLNPIVDLAAGTTVKSYRAMEMTSYDITLSVRGPLDEAEFEFVSIPPLERSDIVSLLTIGATREQLAGRDMEGEAPSVSGIILERAKELSSRRVAAYISRNVGGLLGLDQVTIDGNLFRFDKSWGPELLASKKFSDKVEITYKTNIGHLNDQSIRLDYRLTERFSLQGETDQFGRSGLDFKYGLRFK